MMRTTIFGLALAVGLSGCATLSGTSDPSDPGTIIKIQNAAIASCNFLPTASTVTQLLSSDPQFAANPKLVAAAATAALIEDVAAAVCQAVTAPAPHALIGRASVVTIDGIPVIGAFVTAH